jgi:hypothetical protein
MSRSVQRLAIFLAPIGVLLAAAPALAAPSRLDAVLACRNVEEAAARLECFDRESALLASTPAVVAQTPPPAPAMPSEKAFGLPPLVVAEAQSARIEQPAKIETLDGKIVGLSLGENGRVVVTLDNGQVWRQLMAGEDLMLRLGDTVHLSRGIVGSYFMKVPSGRTCKVSRLR